MRIYISSVLVDDVSRAHDFYTEKLGFQVKDDVENDGFRWLTVTNAGIDPSEASMELLLEPKGHPAAAPFTEGLKASGIPLTQFLSDDVEAETAELKEKGVEFTTDPMDIGPAKIAVFDDTVGNLIQLIQLKK